MELRRLGWRLLGMALLVTGFFLALEGIVGLGNNAGPVEAILTFLGAGALVVLGWLAWDRATAVSSVRRTNRP
jgi:hypothetical protein